MSDERGELSATVEEMCRRRAELIRRREFDRMVDEFYAPDGILLPSGEPSLRGREAIRGFWRERPEKGLISLTLSSSETAGSEELAYEIGRFESTVRPPHGAPFQDHGKYLVIYRKQPEGAFRAVAEMFNSDARR